MKRTLEISYWFWLSGVWGSLLAGDEIVGVRVLDGDSDEVRTRFFPLSFDVRGSAALTDQVRLVGDLLRRDLSLKVRGRGDWPKCGPAEGFGWPAAANAAACMYAGSAIFLSLTVNNVFQLCWSNWSKMLGIVTKIFNFKWRSLTSTYWLKNRALKHSLTYLYIEPVLKIYQKNDFRAIHQFF